MIIRLRMLDACVFAIMCSLSGLKLIFWRQCFRKIPTGTKFTGQFHLPSKDLLVRSKSSYIAKPFFSLLRSVKKAYIFLEAAVFILRSKTVLNHDLKETVFFQGICNWISTVTFLFSLSLNQGFIHIYLFRMKTPNLPTPTMFSNENIVGVFLLFIK